MLRYFTVDFVKLLNVAYMALANSTAEPTPRVTNPVFSKKYIFHVLRFLQAMVDSHQPRSSQVGHDGAEFVMNL